MHELTSRRSAAEARNTDHGRTTARPPARSGRNPIRRITPDADTWPSKDQVHPDAVEFTDLLFGCCFHTQQPVALATDMYEYTGQICLDISLKHNLSIIKQFGRYIPTYPVQSVHAPITSRFQRR